MKYNLARNGYLTALTSSGTGNVALTWQQLNSLVDGVTTSGVVTLTSSNSLWLFTDLSQRIKLDSIRLYADDLTQSGGISFYVKNEENENYTQLSTNVSEYYYPTLIEPKAPRFILTILSGVNLDLYEFMPVNDDYVVGFGEDGQLFGYTLDNTVVGAEGKPEAIPIYNNSDQTMPINAYTCVECVGSGYDNYIELASLKEGPYYKISDGALVDSNIPEANKYTWSHGTFNNTAIDVTNDNVYCPAALNYSTYNLDMGVIPVSHTGYSWGVGQNCWDYDPVNRVIYAIGVAAADSLRLYKKYIDYGDWIDVGQINPGVTDFASWASMCYIDGYVYVLCRLDGTHFGRYNVNGPADNWEPLASINWITAASKIGMCGDKNRYVYVIYARYDMVDNSADKSFVRYDTTTDVWINMANGYANNYSSNSSSGDARRACLSYDTDRDVIYADVGFYSNGNYIQRYDVKNNSWNTAWFNVNTNTGVSQNYNQTQSYYNNILFLGHTLTGTTLYYYNVSTGQVSSLVRASAFYGASGGFGGTSSAFSNPAILATDAPVGIDGLDYADGWGVWTSQLSHNRQALELLTLQLQLDQAGTYTSPIFSLEDKQRASYFFINRTADPSIGDVGYDKDVYNGSVKVRSSDTEPLPIFEMIYAARTGTSTALCYTWVPYINSYGSFSFSIGGGKPYGLAVTVNPQTGDFFTCIRKSNIDFTLICRFNRSKSQIVDRQVGNYTLNFNVAFEFGGENNIWGYGNVNDANCRTLTNINATTLATISTYSESQQDFVYAMDSSEIDGCCWYTNPIDNTLVHMNRECKKLNIINLPSPRRLCRTTDGGCWVYDDVDYNFYRYDWWGNRIKTVKVPVTSLYAKPGCTRMTSDKRDGFWYRHGVMLRHMTSEGVVDVGPVSVPEPNNLQGAPIGCCVYSTTYNTMYWVDMNGDIIYTRATDSNNPSPLFGVFFYDYAAFEKYKSKYIPVSYDPIWGTSGSLKYIEAPKNGYFLPKVKYHQVDVQLRGKATLDGIYMAPAIKLDDIPSKHSKNIYVKTNIPLGANIDEYTINLRTWWNMLD